MHDPDTTPDLRAQGRQSANKLPWKKSANGNRYLKFYDLTVTVFPSKRGSGFSVSIAQRGEPPLFFNYATEADARAAAEQKFREMKGSGKFTAPVPMTMADLVKEVLKKGYVPSELEHLFCEMDATREHENENADLIYIHEYGRSEWVPHSQGRFLHDIPGRSRLLVTKWWLERKGLYDE